MLADLHLESVSCHVQEPSLLLFLLDIFVCVTSTGYGNGHQTALRMHAKLLLLCRNSKATLALEN